MNKQQKQKITSISLMSITIVLAGVFLLPNTIASINAQNTPTNSIDVQSVKDLLDQAVDALNNGDTTLALQQLDKAEDTLDTTEDQLEVMLRGTT
ncbi:MAG: hypothetical protein AB7P56_08095 [Nitrososphaeraceae archaeon]